MMKIVICTHQLPRDEPGGVGAFSVDLARELVGAGHDVTLLVGSALRPARPDADADLVLRRGGCWLEEVAPAATGARTLRLQRSDAARTALGRFTSSFTHGRTEALLEQALRQLAPDLVHVQHTINLSARLGSIAIRAGAAVVASVHDFWPICQRIDLRRPDGTACPGPAGGLRCAACLPPLGRVGDRSINVWDAWRRLRGAGARSLELGLRAAPYVLRTQLVQGGYALAHRVTCPAPSTHALLQRAGFDPRRLSVVDYGIPELPPGVAQVARPRRPLRLGFLGTLGAHKGPWVALRAAELLMEESPLPWQLSVHGGPLRDAALRERLHGLTEASGERVQYRGPYTRERLPGILAGLDAVVIPSVWPETGPMVWMEALAAGLPVVASRVGALAERVRHGEDGLLFPPGDAGALAAAVRELMAGYDRLRQGALARPVRSVSQAAGELLVVYEEARREASR